MTALLHHQQHLTVHLPTHAVDNIALRFANTLKLISFDLNANPKTFIIEVTRAPGMTTNLVLYLTHGELLIGECSLYGTSIGF